MNTFSPLISVAALLPLLLAACATPLAAETRVHLGGQSFVALRLPVGWELRPVFDGQPTVRQVRVFREATEVMQVMPVQWSNAKTEPDSSLSHLRLQAISKLNDLGLCANAEVQEHALPHGLAIYCPRIGAGTGVRVSGVLANGRMTAAFTIFDIEHTSAGMFWQILSTVKHFSFEYAA